MVIPSPESQFDRLGPHLPDAPLWAWRTAAGAGLLMAAGAAALGQFWPAAGLLLAGCLAAGIGEARARHTAAPAHPILPLGLLLLPFGFALADPSRALAAMFVLLALSVLTVLGRGNVSVVTWLGAAGFLIACIFPNHFSLLAYLIGVTAFIAAGQGVAKDWV